MQSPTARAAVLHRFNEPLEIESYPLPKALDPGAVLVRTEMAGICGTDVHLWKGELPIALPVILGHETVGRVVALGPGVDRDWNGKPLKVGDRVTWTSTTSCGHCYYCAVKRQPTRCPERRAYGIGYRCDQAPHLLGGYAEFHYLRPRANIFVLPAELPTEVVVGAGCALLTAIHGIERLGTGWQETVVVQGAGPVGIAALAVARGAGASRVIVVDGPPDRLAMARRFGADAVIDMRETPTAEGRIAAIRNLTEGYGADQVIECVGHPSAVVEGMEMCRDGGKYLVLGHYCNAGTIEFNPHIITRKQLQIFGSWSSEPRHLAAALDFMSSNRERFPFEQLISQRFSLERAHEALMTSRAGQSGKSVLTP